MADCQMLSKVENPLVMFFYRMGFNDQEITDLVKGDHALGRCHPKRSCFHGPWTRSPIRFRKPFLC